MKSDLWSVFRKYKWKTIKDVPMNNGNISYYKEEQKFIQVIKTETLLCPRIEQDSITIQRNSKRKWQNLPPHTGKYTSLDDEAVHVVAFSLDKYFYIFDIA